MRADFVPERDAPAVARLKAAGAIILGENKLRRDGDGLHGGQSGVWQNEQSV